MKKSIIAALSAFVLMISLCGCGFDKDEHLNKEIHKKYYDMKAFTTKVEVVSENSQAKDKYTARQWYSKPDKFAIEVIEPKEYIGSGYKIIGDEIVILSNGGKTFSAFNLKTKGYSSISVADFFEEYFKNGKSVPQGLDQQSQEVILSIDLPEADNNQTRQKLWLDGKTLLPVKLVTYDAEEKPRVTVNFLDFDINITDIEEKFK